MKGRLLNGNTAVVSYRAIVGVLLSVIAGLVWAMWGDISGRQDVMSSQIGDISKAQAASSATLDAQIKRIDQDESDIRAINTRIDGLGAGAPSH